MDMDISGKPVILVVDDLEQNILYIETILKPLEVTLIKAYSGHEALEKIRDYELALALIDVQMPGMSGLELATAILTEKHREIFPIVFVTAYPLKGDNLVDAYKSGITDFLTKPFDRNILLSKVRIFLELYRQKQKLAESERLYRMLLNASPEGVIIMNTDGTIRELSNIASAVLGTDHPEGLAGTPFKYRMPEDEHHRFSEVIKSVVAGELAQNIEFRVLKGDREQVMCELSLTRISDKSGRHPALMAIIRDISERKRMEQQQIQTERMASLGEMATGIAHEINQPLNNISFGLDNLLAEIHRQCDISNDYFEQKSIRIFENIKRISYIIDHIRTFSRGQDDFIPSLFSICDSIRNAVSMISEQFRLHDIDLKLDLPGEINPILGNTYRFEQVILNMLYNAKDALEEKEKTTGNDFIRSIIVRVRQDLTNIYTEVTDNGVGMTQDIIDHVMFPFYTTKKTGKGTGLGLSISLGIIKELHGTIEVESEYLKGTTIRIILPA